MQYGDEDRPFHGEFKFSVSQQRLQQFGDADLMPQLFEYECGANVTCRTGLHSICLDGFQDRRVLRELGQRNQQTLQVARFLKLIQSSDSTEDLLPDFAVDAMIDE